MFIQNPDVQINSTVTGSIVFFHKLTIQRIRNIQNHKKYSASWKEFVSFRFLLASLASLALLIKIHSANQLITQNVKIQFDLTELMSSEMTGWFRMNAIVYHLNFSIFEFFCQFLKNINQNTLKVKKSLNYFLTDFLTCGAFTRGAVSQP